MKDALKEKILASKPFEPIEMSLGELIRVMSGEMDSTFEEARKRHSEKGLEEMAGEHPDASHFMSSQEANDLADKYVERAQQSLDQTEPVPPTFEEVVKPLIKWMAENNCPHSHVVVTGTGAELFHGMKSFNTFEFVSD